MSGLGVLVAFLFGALVWRTQFCIAGSVYSSVAATDKRGQRGIFLVIAARRCIGLEPYLAVTLLTSSCGAGSLVTIGDGDLRAVVV